jgi:putative ABC transport system permease protein
MKAIGAKSRFILILFLSEALLIGIIGASVGLVTGMGGACLLTTGFAPRGPDTGGGQPGAPAPHFNPLFVADQLLNVWILSVSLSIASGIFPAWKAARLSPLEALRR